MDGDRLRCAVTAPGCKWVGSPDMAGILEVAVNAYDGRVVVGEISRTPDRTK